MIPALFFCLQKKQQRLKKDQVVINETLETSRLFVSETERKAAEVDAMAQVRYGGQIPETYVSNSALDPKVNSELKQLSLFSDNHTLFVLWV